MGFEILSEDGKPYKKKVTCIFYSELEDSNAAKEQIRKLCLKLGDRFEGVVDVKDMGGS